MCRRSYGAPWWGAPVAVVNSAAIRRPSRSSRLKVEHIVAKGQPAVLEFDEAVCPIARVAGHGIGGEVTKKPYLDSKTVERGDVGVVRVEEGG